MRLDRINWLERALPGSEFRNDRVVGGALRAFRGMPSGHLLTLDF